MMKSENDERTEERQAVPRVQHLGYFDAALQGIQAGMTFDELRVHLAAVGRDIARYEGRFLAPQRTSPHYFWRTCRDALLGLMQCNYVASRPLPATKDTAMNHAGNRYTLTGDGKALLRQGAGSQREKLAVAVYRTYPVFRRYLARLALGPLFVPEFTEGDLVRLGVARGQWTELATEVGQRLESAVGARADVAACAAALGEFVTNRFERRTPHSRKELLDAVNDGVGRFVAHSEQIVADAVSLNVIHEWARQLFLIGSSRYVNGVPSGLLQWSACWIQEDGTNVAFHRKTIPDVVPAAVKAIAQAYRQLRRGETGMVEYYRLRATAAFSAGAANDIIDRIVFAMVSGTIPNTLGLQPSAGAQWSPPPSERPLRIGGRRYTLIALADRERSR